MMNRQQRRNKTNRTILAAIKKVIVGCTQEDAVRVYEFALSCNRNFGTPIHVTIETMADLRRINPSESLTWLIDTTSISIREKARKLHKDQVANQLIASKVTPEVAKWVAEQLDLLAVNYGISKEEALRFIAQAIGGSTTELEAAVAKHQEAEYKKAAGNAKIIDERMTEAKFKAISETLDVKENCKILPALKE